MRKTAVRHEFPLFVSLRDDRRLLAGSEYSREKTAFPAEPVGQLHGCDAESSRDKTPSPAGISRTSTLHHR